MTKQLQNTRISHSEPFGPLFVQYKKGSWTKKTYGDNSYQATAHIKRQLISGDNSYQFEKATTHIKRQLVSIKTHIRKSKSTWENLL